MLGTRLSLLVAIAAMSAASMACSSGDHGAAATSEQGVNQGPLALACELHYFDTATGMKILNAAQGQANVSTLASTPLVLATPENVTASVHVVGDDLVVDVSGGGQALGSGHDALSGAFPTNLQLAMPPIVKADVTYDAVWVGCWPTAPVMAPVPPGTDRRESQALSVEQLVDTLATFSAWHDPVDAAAVKARERASIASGDGSDGVFFAAAWDALNAFPQGHQRLSSSDPTVCGKALPDIETSRFGVCGRPSDGGLVVTVARAGNPLGLSVGDVVTDAGGDTGEDIYMKAYARPRCGALFPAPSGRRASGAATFFGTVPAGQTLQVTTRDGQTRSLVVPATADADPTDCTDPFGRDRNLNAEATIRPDGVAVIRLPTFWPAGKDLPANPTQADVDAFTAAYQSDLVAIFATVKSAPAIIWDARGNTGGMTPVALAIVSGFSTATATQLSYCQTRVSSSSPPAFDGERYAEYGITPGGPFTYSGKVAVVTDGLAYSAGDYFTFAALRGGHALVVGSATAGAFGGGDGPIDIAGPPSMSANYDPTGCFDAATSTPLEAAPLAPTVAVELDAKDVAMGRDTVIERAVKELGF
jgi:hypothetical protein